MRCTTCGANVSVCADVTRAIGVGCCSLCVCIARNAEMLSALTPARPVPQHVLDGADVNVWKDSDGT